MSTPFKSDIEMQVETQELQKEQSCGTTWWCYIIFLCFGIAVLFYKILPLYGIIPFYETEVPERILVINYKKITNDIDLLSFIPKEVIAELDNGYINYTENKDIFRKSRVITGDVSYFWHLFHKILIKKECILSLVIGGSVSAGHKKHDKTGKWWNYFNDWINAKYPCMPSKNNNKTYHQIISKAKEATGSDYAVQHFYSLFQQQQKHFDIIFIEYAINDAGSERDYFVNNKVNEPNGTDIPFLFSLEYEIARTSEILVRKLLSLDQNNEPLIVYIEMGWDRSSNGKGSTQYFKTSVFGHEKIAFYYQIPMISLVHVMLPIDIYSFCSKYVNEECPQNKKWFTDTHHPTVDGHKLAALLIAYNFNLEQVNGYRQISEYDSNGHQQYLPKPWILTEEEAENYSKHLIPIISLDFSLDTMPNVIYQKYIVYNDGWYHDFETSKKKYGLIANTADSFIIFQVNATKSINIWYLKTYKNIGSVTVWISNKLTNNTKHCSNAFAREPTNKYDQIINIDGYHESKTSVFQNTEIKINENNAKNITQILYAHICVLPKQEHGNKFKLLQILTF